MDTEANTFTAKRLATSNQSARPTPSSAPAIENTSAAPAPKIVPKRIPLPSQIKRAGQPKWWIDCKQLPASHPTTLYPPKSGRSWQEPLA